MCSDEVGVLKLLEGFMVQVEARVASEVQLLKFWRQILWESDLTQLITAQVHTLKNRMLQMEVQSCKTTETS